MADDNGKLPRRDEKTLIADAAVDRLRLELEKLAQHIVDSLRLADEGLIDSFDTLDRVLLDARRWAGVYQFYATTLPTQVAFPIPDHEDDKIESWEDS
jgi:hypothetical protein